MNYMARMAELNAKMEKEGLTEQELAENKLYYSMALLALQESNRALLKEIRDITRSFEK